MATKKAVKAKKPEVKPGESPEEKGDKAIGEFMSEFSKKFEEHKKQYEREHNYKFPITVTGVKFAIAEPITHEAKLGGSRNEVGQMVAIRPCDEEFQNKTFLGILIGYVPIHRDLCFVRPEGKEEGELIFKVFGDNPVIFVPDLKRCFMGCASWWGAIKDETQLKQITNEDIQNVWYVRALKELAEREAKKPDGKKA